jgi:hypothetical protein
LVVPQGAAISFFDATLDRNGLAFYYPDWRSNSLQHNTTAEPGRLALKLSSNKPAAGQMLAFQIFVGDKIESRSEDGTFDQLVVKAKSGKPQSLKITLITKDGAVFSETVKLDTVVQNIAVPLIRFKRDSALLLPRPYPGFMPLHYTAAVNTPLVIMNVDKLQISFMPDAASTEPVTVEVQAVWLEKKSEPEF